MSEWWTYSLTNFLLFSPRTYYRLFELYNAEVWPLQLVTLALGIAIAFLVWRPRPWSGRAIAAILAALWLFVAWAYLLERYDTINWAARYFAIAFVLQAALLVWTGVIRNRLGLRLYAIARRIGFALLLYALAIQPLIAPLDRPPDHPGRNLRPRTRSDRDRDPRHSARRRPALPGPFRDPALVVPNYRNDTLDYGIARGSGRPAARPARSRARAVEGLGIAKKNALAAGPPSIG